MWAHKHVLARLAFGALGAAMAAAGPAAAAPPLVLAEQKISALEGGFAGVLEPADGFGSATVFLGDLDRDGVGDLAVGVSGDDDAVGGGGSDTGAVYVVFLNADGTVAGEQKISATAGAFGGVLDDLDFFGASLAALGDVDGDGVGDLAVGASGDEARRGAIWVLFLNSDGTVKGQQKISATAGGFAGQLDASDFFGTASAPLGDIDGDGVPDLAVGANRDDDGGPDRGALWILFLNPDGTVKAHQKISHSTGGFGAALADFDNFGSALATIGDVDKDGVVDLACGARGDNDGAFFAGATWILFLNPDGTVKDEQKISAYEGGFTAVLDNSDQFGTSAATVGDLDHDGIPDVAVGAIYDDDGETPGSVNRGAVYLLLLRTDGTVKDYRKISDTEGGLAAPLADSDLFGQSVAALGDLDGDAQPDLAVSAWMDDDGADFTGAVYVLFLEELGPTSIPSLPVPALLGLAALLIMGSRLAMTGRQ